MVGSRRYGRSPPHGGVGGRGRTRAAKREKEDSSDSMPKGPGRGDGRREALGFQIVSCGPSSSGAIPAEALGRCCQGQSWLARRREEPRPATLPMTLQTGGGARRIPAMRTLVVHREFFKAAAARHRPSHRGSRAVAPVAGWRRRGRCELGIPCVGLAHTGPDGLHGPEGCCAEGPRLPPGGVLPSGRATRHRGSRRRPSRSPR